MLLIMVVDLIFNIRDKRELKLSSISIASSFRSVDDQIRSHINKD
jgi:hypothetical protein